MDRTENLQRGIAIAPILFIVAILAVLAAAVAAGSGAFNGDISAVSAKAQAAAILEYAEQVKMAVDRVRGHGCSDTQISFENPIVSGYTNPNAPSNKSCHVFDVNGGGITWKNTPKEIFFDQSYGQWGIMTGAGGGQSTKWLGTMEHDLFIVIYHSLAHPSFINKGKAMLAACQEINRLLAIESDPGTPTNLPAVSNVTPWHSTTFIGAFPASGSFNSMDSRLAGKSSFCADFSGGARIIFVTTLIVR